MLIVTETNLIQRSFSELSHSEKARILTERHNVIKQQGNTRDIVADKYDLSPRMVTYYLCIDTLIDELKERLDIKEIPFMAGVDLSFLKKDEQEIVDNILETHGFKVNLKKSNALKKVSKQRNFKYDIAYKILSGKYFDKPKKTKKLKFTTKFKKRINKYFKENQNQSEIEETIEKVLVMYFSQDKGLDDKLVNEEMEM